MLSGGFGEHVTEYAAVSDLNAEILNIAIPDVFVPHGAVSVLREKLGLDSDSIVQRILKKLSDMEGSLTDV